MKSISVKELKKIIDSDKQYTLIDVREQAEYDVANMNGKLIPMSEITNRYAEISKDGKAIIHCRSGKRSADVIHWLEQNHGYTNLYNLEGGIIAWANEIDPSLNVY